MTTEGHVFLVGFMGAGKTTVARIVAEALNRPCIDLDELIEEQNGSSVAEIFAERGEDAFRDLESQVLADLAEEPPSVVACGGGIVLRAENRATLRRLGVVVYLKVTAGEAVARIADATTRPLLAGPGGTVAATSLLTARESLYRSVADVTVETVGCSAAEVADAVVDGVGGAR